MEDMFSLGKKVRGCSYFASRMMSLNAEIIFCPYNYIVDPNLRDIMDIQLEGSVVIFDEAHNIEDTSRDVMSIDLTDEDLRGVIVQLDQAKNSVEYAAHYQDICLTILVRFSHAKLFIL
jgi:Rad3-related DNA helicase